MFFLPETGGKKKLCQGFTHDYPWLRNFKNEQAM